MITESFLNSCFCIVLGKTDKVKKNASLFRDILSVLEFYDKQNNVEIPVSIKPKIECLKKICELSLDGKIKENVIDSVSLTAKYTQLHDFLNDKFKEVLKDITVEDIVKQIRLRKKLISLLSNYDNLSTFLETIKNGTFESTDDIVEDYEVMVKELYSSMMNENRGISIESTASLDLLNDNYEHALKMIQEKYERKNSIPTGYKILDTEVLNGGFEPSRLYIFGGSPGSGKSTLLNNFIINCATKNIAFDLDGNSSNKDGSKNVYIYITLENTIEESLLRTYQPMFSKRINQVLQEISAGVDIKKIIAEQLNKTNSTIIMKYFPAMSISTLDIMAVLDDAISQYGKDSIKGLYVDYLDLLRADTKYDMYRLELGHITLSLKRLAVDYNIPVIVPTQLGRASYRIKDSRDLNNDLMSESVKKVEHADFIGLMAKDPNDDTLVHCRIGKNRSGKANINIEFKVNFDIFKFLEGIKLSNDGKSNILSVDQTGFSGLGKSDF